MGIAIDRDRVGASKENKKETTDNCPRSLGEKQRRLVSSSVVQRIGW